MLRVLLLVTALARGGQGSSATTRVESPADSLPRFPRVEGTNLEGRRFTLPADFSGEYNVVFVAFRREQQADVDSWLPFLREQQVVARGFPVYEVPTLNRTYRLMRGFIDGGMARGIPERATRESTITLYIDKSPFRKSLAIASEDRIRTMIVGRDGQVVWHADGAFTPELGAALDARLHTLGTPREP